MGYFEKPLKTLHSAAGVVDVAEDDDDWDDDDDGDGDDDDDGDDDAVVAVVAVVVVGVGVEFVGVVALHMAGIVTVLDAAALLHTVDTLYKAPWAQMTADYCGST
ncbi:hypothetical protein TcG_00854 [Trypanosoma cruzi]|nr:hypothetical protein TcG_00854 [Trypanosoma cruzi]